MGRKKPKEDSYEFDREFQREIICLSVGNGTFLRESRGALSWEYFTDPIHRMVMDEVLEHFDAHGRAPTRGGLLERLRTRCRKDKSMPFARVRDEVQDVLSLEADSSFISPRVREFASNAGARAILAEFEDYAERGEQEAWFKELDKALKLRHPEPALVKYGTGIEQRLKSYSRGYVKSKPVPTSSTKLNKLLLGGLDAGEMGVVIGLHGYGKSHILVAFGAAAVLAGKKVYHVSLEMQRRTVLRRYDVSLSGLKDSDLAKQASKVIGKLKDGDLWIGSYPSNTLTPSALRSVISRRGAPDLLILDYGKIMRPDSRNQTSWGLVGDIYADLRDIGIEFDCAVWTAGQVNRQGMAKSHSEGDVITMEQIAESFQIGDHADVVLSWNQTRDEKKKKEGRLWVDKNREAEDKVEVAVHADWSLSRVWDT